MADGFLDDAKEWLSYAEADLGVANHLLNTYNPKPFEMVLSQKSEHKNEPFG